MPDRERLAFASQFSLLCCCSDLLGKLLRSKGSDLLAAKVLVISRLLHNKLSQKPNPPPYLDRVKRTLGNLRRKLLSKIDDKFYGPDVTVDSLVEAMCAFSLASSSSSREIMRHYHHIRLKALTEQGERYKDVQTAMVRALRVFVKTLGDTKACFPERLTRALQFLKSAPLFKSQDLRSLVELNLDTHEEWIGDDIKAFIPYIHHDNLQRHETERMITEWANYAFRAFLNELQAKIKVAVDPLTLTQLREKLLRLWLSYPQKSLGFDTTKVLKGLCDVFNAQLVHLIRSQITSLERLSWQIKETLQNLSSESLIHLSSIWNSSISSLETSSGGNALIESFRATTNGENEALRITSLEYASWFQRVGVLRETIKGIQETSWDETDDIENEDDLFDNKQKRLSEDNARLLQAEFLHTLEKSFSTLEDSIQNLVAELGQPHLGLKVVYLTRVLREILRNLPPNFQDPEFGLQSTTKLQAVMVEIAISTPLDVCEKRITDLSDSGQFLGRPLWEGDPELPVLPSSWVFRLLLELVSSMATLARDLWTLKATATLKDFLRIRIASQIEKLLLAPVRTNGRPLVAHENIVEGSEESNEDINSSVDGEILEPRSDGESNRDSKIQLLFDMAYLDIATMSDTKSIQGYRDDFNRVKQLVEMEVQMEERLDRVIIRNAEDYWKRTSTLFALMAQPC